jgi:hypothetical protein
MKDRIKIENGNKEAVIGSTQVITNNVYSVGSTPPTIGMIQRFPESDEGYDRFVFWTNEDEKFSLPEDEFLAFLEDTPENRQKLKDEQVLLFEKLCKGEDLPKGYALHVTEELFDRLKSDDTLKKAIESNYNINQIEL